MILVDSNILPFKDNFFDIIIGWHSLYYNNSETLQEALDEILRILKPNGQFLSSMVSVKQTQLCGTEIAPSVFRPKKKDQSQCIVFCFKNKKQIMQKYRKFKNIQIGFYSSELFGSPKYHYVILAKKPKLKAL